MDLRELYQSMILDHGKNPHNFGECAHNRTAKGNNPLCGDKISLYLLIEGSDDTIKDVSFNGCGCAISTASASIMTDEIKGKTITEAKALFGNFHELITSEKSPEGLPQKMQVFEGVKAFPSRIKCAVLAWHTLAAALDGNIAEISTEDDK